MVASYVLDCFSLDEMSCPISCIDSPCLLSRSQRVHTGVHHATTHHAHTAAAAAAHAAATATTAAAVHHFCRTVHRERDEQGAFAVCLAVTLSEVSWVLLRLFDLNCYARESQAHGDEADFHFSSLYKL